MIDYLLDYGIIFVLAALVAVFSMTSDRFLSANTMFTILRQVSIVGIMSVGMTFVMLMGGIDLSVGSVGAVVCVVTAYFMVHGISPVPACVMSLAVAATAGLANGFCVNMFNIPPLIATMGVMMSLRGIAYLVTNGAPIYGIDKNFKYLSQGTFGTIPYPVILMAAIFVIAAFVLKKTRLGRYIYGVGGNEEASRLSGVKIKKVKYIAYAISSVLAGISGLLLLARTNSGQPSVGSGYEMDAITAVVLGGVSISGGKGNIWLVIVGVVIMGTLSTGMVMSNISDYVQQVIKGLVLIGSIAFAQFSQKIKEHHI
jgi:ribose/xylose/arabinose/galactoside ABC-type transport system permease subunit